MDRNNRVRVVYSGNLDELLQRRQNKRAVIINLHSCQERMKLLNQAGLGAEASCLVRPLHAVAGIVSPTVDAIGVTRFIPRNK